MDPNGERIFVANDNTKQYISKYLIDQFGTDDFIRYSHNNKLLINHKQYRRVFKSTNEYQKTLLRGLKSACRNSSSATVEIDNEQVFDYKRSIPINNDDCGILYYIDVEEHVELESGITIPTGTGRDCFIFINNEGAESTTMSSEEGETGKSASSVFFHELLDEFLNYYVKGKTTDSSSQVEKVFYQNNALQNKGLPPRDGRDHQ